MVRIVSTVQKRRRHKKLIKKMKGAFGWRSKIFTKANETFRRASAYAHRDRRAKKRIARQVWIIRLNAACQEHGIAYSRLIYGLKKGNVALNRKMLSEIALYDSPAFGKLVELAKSA